jgi:hypothetical protein
MDASPVIVESIDAAGIRRAVADSVAASGLSVAELRRQAADGRFTSERARRVAFVVSAGEALSGRSSRNAAPPRTGRTPPP